MLKEVGLPWLIVVAVRVEGRTGEPFQYGIDAETLHLDFVEWIRKPLTHQSAVAQFPHEKPDDATMYANANTQSPGFLLARDPASDAQHIESCRIGLAGDLFATGPYVGPVPNRWLVFSITLAVTLRLCFGVIRAWRLWRATPEGGSWVAEAGLAGSMAAGAVALGYYLIFWAGVWILAKKHRRETAATPRQNGNDQGISPSL